MKCFVGVKLLNVFIIILYFLHCFSKLRECHQYTENIHVYDVSLEYRKSLCFQTIVDKLQKRRMMMVRSQLGQRLVYIANLRIGNNSVLLTFCRTLLFHILILCLEHFDCTFSYYYKKTLIYHRLKNGLSHTFLNIF
jgi:hypothetical protein